MLPTPLKATLEAVANSELAFQIGATWWFPLLETLHVIGLVTLVGAMMTADLRLLRLSGMQYSREIMLNEHLPWVWFGFALAVMTGISLFISRPVAYAENVAFQLKMGLLLLAGLNAWWHHRRGKNDTTTHDRWSAALSITFWLAIVLAGRWVGHTN